MAEFMCRCEEGEGLGTYHVCTIYSHDVAAGDYCIIDKKDYPDLIIKAKVSDACDVVLDAVAVNRAVPEAGIDPFITVDEIIASFPAGGGEAEFPLSDILAKRWALNFPYLRFKFTSDVTIDFITACTTAEAKADLKSELYLGVKDMTVKMREVMYIASAETIAVNNLVNNGLIRVDGKLIAREIHNGGTIQNGGIVELWQ